MKTIPLRQAAVFGVFALVLLLLAVLAPDFYAKNQLRMWTEEAIANGVFGVPTLAVGGELFWGLDAMPMAEAYLADSSLLTRGEMARLANLPTGVGRRIG